MTRITISYLADDEWDGELTVTVSADGFAGVGSAWFSKLELLDFAQAITAYPLSAAMPHSISGGRGGNSEIPPQELVKVTFEPHNTRGAIRASIHLEAAIQEGSEQDLKKATTVSFLVTYNDLAEFGPAIGDVVNGRAAEAILTVRP
ncbi:hypothetical protein [Novosphingobium sp. FKTRR1]|uniref:hypothetical protein n=1 Tax=Novosphingobium sp. FKTRR1 TaxID=2879118 RepID=UPI001CF03A97|nr:hypothetical protein [Novosphingobium sp. FKTRR1]